MVEILDPRFEVGPEIDKLALETQAGYIADRTVALWQTPASGGEWIGSATAVRVGEHILLATAAHNLRNLRTEKELKILPPQPESGAIGALRWNCSDDGSCDFPDVAWIEIPPESEGKGGLALVELEEVPREVGHQPDQAFWCQGYPSAEVRLESGRGRDLLSLGVASYSCPEGKDAATSSRNALTLEYPPSDWPGRWPEPNGLSGGGVWRLPGYWQHIVWSPSSCRLVAITRQWAKSTSRLYATPIARWLELLVADREDLRGLVGERLSSRD